MVYQIESILKKFEIPNLSHFPNKEYYVRKKKRLNKEK